MANPRIDELRRRIEREPGSRLFSQLAEELRKDGDLAEAIRVARSGLAAHPNYPSARLTLGRALFDTGQFGPARIELEAVLRGAPDNILAARMLAECLEGLGDAGAALLQYRAAQRLSPDDKQIEAQVRSIEHRLAAGGSARTAVAPPAALGGSRAPAGQAAALAPPPAPAPPPLSARAAAGAAQAPTGAPVMRSALSPKPAGALVEDFDDVFEPAPAWKRSPETAPVPKDETILLLEDEAPTLPGPSFHRAADSDPPSLQEGISPPVTLAFEEAPVLREAPPSPEGRTGPEVLAGSDTLAGAPAFVVPLPPQVFEAAPSPAFEAPPGLATSLAPGSRSGEARPDPESTSTAAFAAFHEPPPPEPAPSWPAPFAPVFSASAPPVAEPPLAVPPAVSMAAESAEPSAEAKGAALSTPTLAELYCDQGFYEKAVEVYEKILEREPHNERARARLIEVKALALALSAPPAPDPRAGERRALQHKIARLEQMLAAVRRG